MGCDILAGSVRLGTFRFCCSSAAAEGRGGLVGSGAGGLDSVAGVVVGAGTATPGGGGCMEGARTVPADGGSFF